jgi:cyclin T
MFKMFMKQQKKVLLGEKLVLITLNFDINIHHSYQPLVVTIGKF